MSLYAYALMHTNPHTQVHEGTSMHAEPTHVNKYTCAHIYRHEHTDLYALTHACAFSEFQKLPVFRSVAPGSLVARTWSFPGVL